MRGVSGLDMADTLRLDIQMQTLRTRGALVRGALRCAFLFPLFPLPFGEWEHAKSLIYKDVPTVPTQKHDQARRRGEISLKVGGAGGIWWRAQCTPTFPKSTPICTPTYPRMHAHSCALIRTNNGRFL